ncbi:hypothetical protein [Paracoccus sp. KR1-242]|uniref:hypothetical protein n=1 Tax=Paracoccus sp. KR1-242 TaxID=3410028 RepID=UPI003C1108C1
MNEPKFQPPADILIREAVLTPEVLRYWSNQTLQTISAIVTARLHDDDLTRLDDCRALWAAAALAQARKMRSELLQGGCPSRRDQDQLLGVLDLLGDAAPEDVAEWIRHRFNSFCLK